MERGGVVPSVEWLRPPLPSTSSSSGTKLAVRRRCQKVAAPLGGKRRSSWSAVPTTSESGNSCRINQYPAVATFAAAVAAAVRPAKRGQGVHPRGTYLSITRPTRAATSQRRIA